MLVSLLVIIGLALALVVYCLVKIAKDKKAKINNLYTDNLPNFPLLAKLYIDEQTDIICRRCSTEMGEAKLMLRRRYALLKDGQGGLRSKRLAFLYSCNNCGYKNLDKPNRPE